MTISTGGNASRSIVRVISRSLRLRRLRSTEDWRCLGTTIPTRRCPRREREALTRTSRCSVRRRFPVRAIARNSVPRVMRRLRGKWADVCGWCYELLLQSALCACVLGREPYRQLLPPFLAAACKYLTAPFIGHTKTKTVGSNTALVARTVGWLTHT